MAKYAVNGSQSLRDGYEAKVAIPMAFIMVFSFAFLVMHPFYSKSLAKDSSVKSSLTSSKSVDSKLSSPNTTPISHLNQIQAPAISNSPSVSSSTTSNLSPQQTQTTTSTSSSATVSPSKSTLNPQSQSNTSESLNTKTTTSSSSKSSTNNKLPVIKSITKAILSL